jgi:cold shock CspA family protein
VVEKAWPLTDERESGQVRKLVRERSYGFIRDPMDNEVFFHRTDLQSPSEWTELTDGTPVTFLLAVAAEGRRQATFVKRT